MIVFKDFTRTLFLPIFKMGPNDLTAAICLGIALCFSIYLIVMYSIRVNELSKLSNPKDREYRKDNLQKVMVSAVRVLVKHANLVAQPYFYTYPIDYILSSCPAYIQVLIFIKYTLDYPQSKNDLHDLLVELYGSRFEESAELNVLVKVKTSDFGFQEYYHYLLQHFEKGTYVYIHNKHYIDQLILLS